MYNFKKDLLEVIADHPKLKIIERGAELLLSGEVDLIYCNSAEVIDTYSLEISFPQEFPYRFPKVSETSGKIARVADRHIFSQNNTMCFAVVPEELLKCRFGITVKWFIDKVLIPRLGEEYLVSTGGKYVHEYSHGIEGKLEYYMKELNASDTSEVIKHLKNIYDHKLPKGFEKCPCGSNLKFKKCHQKMYNELINLGKEFIGIEILSLEYHYSRLNQKKIEDEKRIFFL